MKTYSVIMLGASGSGKTVFLASMHKKLSTQGKLGFFLEIEGAENRKRLNSIYKQVAVDEKWPRGTSFAEISEWNFTCSVQTENRSIYPACKFVYLDYAGGRITDEMEEEDDDFENRLKETDALLGLLDGQRLCALMRKEKAGMIWALNDLANMLVVMQRIEDKPLHFVISKWDVVESNYTLKQIRDRLLEIEEFTNLARTRTKQKTPIRLIPVSAVGKGFAIPQADGSMAKNIGILPKPFQVEAPFACVLPDIIQAQLEELIRKKEAETNKQIEVKPQIGFWGRLGQLVGGGMRAVQQLLPKKYQLAENVLDNLIDFFEKPAQQKEEDAIRRTEELRAKQRESLKKVADEETALEHAVNCFMSIQDRLDRDFPESDLRKVL